MLTDATKQEIRDKLELIRQAIPTFRSRPGQLVMIAEVAKALSRCPDAVPGGKDIARPAPGASVVLVQGGTGIGKSLGYTLPGIVLARQKKKKLVISSSTVALQEQLAVRDIPLFFGAAKIAAKVEIAKGRTRYVCGYRLLQAAADLSQTSMFGRHERSMGTTTSAVDAAGVVKEMIDSYNKGSWNGDRDAWASPVDDTFWSAVTTDRHGCLGNNCPSYRSCAQIAARKRVREADVIVANHDIVLADLAMGGKIIAKPEDCFYCFDEAHHLPERAVSAFATSHYVGAGRRLMGKTESFAAAFSQSLASTQTSLAQSIASLAKRLGENLNDAFQYFSSLAQLKPTSAITRPTLEFELSCIPEEFHAIGANVKALSAELASKLEAAAEALSSGLGADRTKQPVLEKLRADAGFMIGKVEEVRATWELFLEEPALDQPPIAKWIEASEYRNHMDYQMCASPVLASGYLRNLLWEKAAGVVLASATITTLGNFTDFLHRTGLSQYSSAVTCVELPSSFDYQKQATLEIAKMTSSPKDYEGHTTESTERIKAFVALDKGEGTLVLFASRRQMDDVARRLPVTLRNRLLIQGQGSKAAIMREHKDRIDRGLASTIFGLDSFSEGVDLPDKYCTNVIIAKLPFSVPDDPVLRTLADWVTRRGGNAFMEIAVPAAARKLEQSVGRLIRTETDHGYVTVLDTRLWNTRFGKAILRGLPPFRLVANNREVRLS